MPSSPLVELFVERNAGAIEAEILEGIETAFEDWEPAAGDPLVWFTKGFTRIAAGIFDVASIVTRKAFRTFGETIINVPPILPTPATAQSTWEAINDAGHEIPAGTLVDIVEGDTTYSFRTVGKIDIPAGKTKTEVGEVLLEAVQAGTEYNGLTRDPVLSTALAAVKPEAIELEGTTSGGVDEESEDAYIARLAEELQTLTISAVLPRDYAILARRIAGVARAVALDNYDPVTEETNAPLVVSVAVVDAAGGALSEAVRDEVKALLESRSLQNVTTHVIDPTFTKVGAKVKFTLRPGFDKATTEAAVEQTLQSYLSPATWGMPAGEWGETGTPAEWENVLGVYLNEVIPVVDRVAGVGRVTKVELAKNAGAFAAADVTLDGPAALAEPGTIEATAE
jgi:hypothetical protein